MRQVGKRGAARRSLASGPERASGRGPRGWLALVLALVGGLVTTGGALAAPGDLDTTFSGDGKWTLDFGGENISANDLLIRPDGSIVLVGKAGAFNDVAIMALRPDGSDTIEESFADFGGNDSGRAVARQANGALVVAGSTGLSDIVVLRFTADLQPDPSFDTDGRKVIDLGGFDDAHDVLVQPDGKIVLVGEGTAAEDIVVVRLNADGSLDGSFDGDGIATVDLGRDESAEAVALQADGKLVVVGGTFQAQVVGDLVVVRLNANGSLDGNLDADGRRTIDLGGPSDAARAVAVQVDGKLLVFGDRAANGDAALLRLNPDGALDATFASDGSLELDLGVVNDAADIALRSDGKIVLASTEVAGAGLRDMGVSQVLPNGVLDVGFDFDGKKTIELDGADTASGVAVQPDGAIVVAGTSGFPTKIGVARVLSDLPVAPTPAPAPAPPAPAPAPPAPPPAPASPSGPTCNGLAATIVGTSGADRLKGTAGPDVILGLGGSDVIDAKGGDDVVCAGGGPDVVKGGNGADVLLGQAGPDDLRGGAGPDRLLGGAGVDALLGGGGRDECTGGAGSDSGACEAGTL